MRITREIEIEEKRAVALFDTGSMHTYVKKPLLTKISGWRILKPYRVAIGGTSLEAREIYHVNGKIEGFDFDTEVVPIDEIGKINGQDIEVIIGALTMEKWEITVNPKDGTLDLSGLKRREFTEFFEQDKISK
jgi:predicted aspartyl protease